MSSSLTKYVDYATLPTGIPSKLPASVKNLEIEKYLTDFANEIHFTDRIEVDDARKMRKLTFNHAAAMKNVTDNMEKYGLRLEIDAANLPVVIQTTVRPPFETLVAFRSPAGEKKERYMAVFNTKHCQILRSQHWTEIVVDFISPQQDSIALADLDADSTSKCPDLPESQSGSQFESDSGCESGSESSVVIRQKLPSNTEYWSTWKNGASRTNWDFLTWYEGGCKKWSSIDRATDEVNVNCYSKLKRIYENLRDALDEAGGVENYKKTKFKECTAKVLKRHRTCERERLFLSPIDPLSSVRIEKISF